MRTIEKLEWDGIHGARNPWVSISVATVAGTAVGFTMVHVDASQEVLLLSTAAAALVAGSIAHIATFD